jgi:hypothetical protein
MQQRIGTRRHPELASKSGLRFATERDGDGGQRRLLALSPLGMVRCDVLQPLAKDLPGTGVVVAEEPPDAHLELHGKRRPRQIGERAHVSAVDAIGAPAAERTARRLVFGCGKDHQASVPEEQRLDVQRWGNREAGEDHRAPPSVGQPRREHCLSGNGGQGGASPNLILVANSHLWVSAASDRGDEDRRPRRIGGAEPSSRPSQSPFPNSPPVSLSILLANSELGTDRVSMVARNREIDPSWGLNWPRLEGLDRLARNSPAVSL